jgi:hypothetical protein
MAQDERRVIDGCAESVSECVRLNVVHQHARELRHESRGAGDYG